VRERNERKLPSKGENSAREREGRGRRAPVRLEKKPVPDGWAPKQRRRWALAHVCTRAMAAARGWVGKSLNGCH
jgi:hypothetical protein